MKAFQHAIPMIVASALLTASMALADAPPKKHSSKPSTHSGKLHKSSHRVSKKSRKPRGQQAIDDGRAREIQQALVREHYLSGEPTGTWDSATQAAMRRYQSDQGWQSKTVPDSRALIRLGLGPNHDHLLNPESAMVSGSTPVQSARAASGNSRGGPVSMPGQRSTSAPVSVSSDLSSSR
jgi:peptidoglycan hydrolase-like protein with peptidoglycan-binding domain